MNETMEGIKYFFVPRIYSSEIELLASSSYLVNSA